MSYFRRFHIVLETTNLMEIKILVISFLLLLLEILMPKVYVVEGQHLKLINAEGYLLCSQIVVSYTQRRISRKEDCF